MRDGIVPSDPSSKKDAPIDPRAALRAIIAADQCISPLSVFDPISARIAEEAGGPVMMLAGSVASLVVLADPDVATITLTELVSLVRRICRVSTLPLIIDADHGYGNALNVRRTVEELELAGASALTIEDTALPQAFGTGGAAELISIAEACGKLQAALDARRDPRLVIIGRTGGAGLNDIDDAIERVKAYENLGVDMVFIRDVKTFEQLQKLNDAVAIPIFLSTSNRALRDHATLSGTRVRIVLRGHRPIMAAYQAAAAAMRADMEGGDCPDLLPGDALARLTRQTDVERRQERYLSTRE